MSERMARRVTRSRLEEEYEEERRRIRENPELAPIPHSSWLPPGGRHIVIADPEDRRFHPQAYWPSFGPDNPFYRGRNSFMNDPYIPRDVYDEQWRARSEAQRWMEWWRRATGLVDT